MNGSLTIGTGATAIGNYVGSACGSGQFVNSIGSNGSAGCGSASALSNTAGSGVLPVTVDGSGDLGSSHVSDTGSQITVSEAVEATSFQVTSSGPTITEGSSAPSGSCSNGSIYLDSNGGSTWGCIGTAWLPMLADVIAATLPGTSTNDWNPTNLAVASTLAVTTTGATNTLTGLTAPAAAGRRITIINVDASNSLILASNSSSSSAANRITGPWGTVNIVLPGGANASVTLEYESSSRWRIIAYSLNDYPSIISDSTYTVGGSTGPTWSSGSAAPSGSCTTGSLYSRTSGSIGFYVCASSAWLTVITSTGITNTAGSGVVPVTIDGSGDLGSGSMTDDGSTATVGGMADTTCTDNTTGAAGIITVTPTAKCTLLRLTETGTQLSIVGIAHTAGMSRTLEIRNETGQTALVYNLNSNASAADQIGGDFSAWPIVTGNSFKVTYDTTLTKWTTSLNSDLGATVVNGAFSSTSNNQLLGGQTKIGNLNTAVLSPSAITGTVNNWSPTGWTNATTTRIEVALSGAVTLTGLAAINAGTYVTLCNTSTTFALTLSDDSGSSSSGNQFFNGNPFAIKLNPHTGPDMECATYQEATAASGWNLIATTASTQGSMEYTSGVTVDSSGITCTSCGITGSALSTAGLVTGGGFVGINGYGATHIEQNDEWMLGGFNRITAATTPLGDSWTLDTSGSISGALGVLGKGRPGIWEMDFGVGAAGAYLDTHTGNNSVDFTTGNWTFEWVGGWPTLSSTSSGTATMYAALVGFFDGGGSISPSNGCFFMYDAGNVSTLGNNSSKVQNLEATCVTGGSHTTYLLNGSGNCDASFVKGTVAATALTYPNTGIQHLKVVMTGHTEADFYTVNGIIATQVCKITTNIPATTSVPIGIQMLFESEAGAGTGARQMDTDYTHWSVDLTSLRSP